MSSLNKKIALTLLGLSCSCASFANSFNVQVEVNSVLGNTPLVLTETRGIVFPVINIDESSTEGSKCYANGNANWNKYINTSYGALHTTATNLCAQQNVPSALVTINGTSNSLLTVTQSAPNQTQNGFDLEINDSTFSPRLDGTGKYVAGINGTLTLIDKAAVTSGLLNFTYLVTAAYQ